MVKRHVCIFILVAGATLLMFAQEKAAVAPSTDDMRQALLGARVLVGASDSEIEPQSESY